MENSQILRPTSLLFHLTLNLSLFADSSFVVVMVLLPLAWKKAGFIILLLIIGTIRSASMTEKEIHITRDPGLDGQYNLFFFLPLE